MEYSQVERDNIEAKQALNDTYLRQNGAYEKKRVIDFFIRYNKPFMVASALASAFGFYFDLVKPFNLIVAVIVALILGAMLEQTKQAVVNGFFNKSFSDGERTFFFFLLVAVVTVAVVYHYKSMQTYSNVSYGSALKEQLDYERSLKERTVSNVSTTLAINKGLNAVLQNGTILDDKSTVETQASNNKLIKEFLSIKGDSYTSRQYLKQEEKTAEQNSYTLLLIFVTIEFFSIFGMIGKQLVNNSASGSLKSLINTMDKLVSLETNVIKAVETKMINDKRDRLNSIVDGISPTPSPTSYNSKKDFNQEEKARIAFGANMSFNAGFMGSKPYFSNGSYDVNNLPSSFLPNPDSMGCNTEKTETKEQKETKNNKEEKKILNLMNFTHNQNEVIKVMFEHGEVKEGQRLVPKRHVKKHFADNRLISGKDVEDVYELLTELELIHHRGGYRASVNMETIVKNS